MAFIPIDAKADVSESKKGKLTPAQHAQLNAWSLANKTGIFDFLGRCEATATTYTATNNVATVVFNKGFFVVCGRLVECEQGTEVQITTPALGSETGWIIAKFNLSTSGTGEFEVTIKKKTENLIQQDLNLNPTTGIYEFVLYDYTAYHESVTIERVNTNYLPSVQSIISDLYQYVSLKHITIVGDITAETRSRFITFDADVTINRTTIPQSSKGTLSTNGNDIVIDVVTPSTVSIIGFYNRSNLTWTVRVINATEIYAEIGDLYQRVSNLGFREGSVSNFISGTTLKKQAKYAILTIPEFAIPVNQTLQYTGTISFTAKETINFSLGGISRYGSAPVRAYGTISGNTITLTTSDGGSYGSVISGSQIGFEISNW